MHISHFSVKHCLVQFSKKDLSFVKFPSKVQKYSESEIFTQLTLFRFTKPFIDESKMVE